MQKGFSLDLISVSELRDESVGKREAGVKM
jgi:hypothetical protein